MKIYLAHSTKFDFKKEFYRPIKESGLAKKHEFYYLYDELNGENPGSTKEIIQVSDVVIAEVSFPSIGLGVELGWADSFGKRIICVYKGGQKGSKFLDVLTKEIFEYNSSEELVKILEEIL